ncbi:hypothetical protein CYMTET_10810 [Cymbomonas tetramitiformis]|uniref:Uncharacterized protein n=1 Tax=Cymbomonas tetramitiformis TaxID=36881 RepID=A0AAE0GNF1_9CHLO|nr:hypothetical protein CYMTET_10810 [Cymbomonas tetramitiformis]
MEEVEDARWWGAQPLRRQVRRDYVPNTVAENVVSWMGVPLVRKRHLTNALGMEVESGVMSRGVAHQLYLAVRCRASAQSMVVVNGVLLRDARFPREVVTIHARRMVVGNGALSLTARIRWRVQATAASLENFASRTEVASDALSRTATKERSGLPNFVSNTAEETDVNIQIANELPHPPTPSAWDTVAESGALTKVVNDPQRCRANGVSHTVEESCANIKIASLPL